MNSNQSSYRSIMKATSVFGGVQVFTIIISIIRSKFIALFLGAGGMGIAGLLTSTIGVVGGLTNFGLGMSAIRDISSANASGDDNRIALVINVLRRWIWVTGLLGVFVVMAFSPLLSKIAFGNSAYIGSFVIISSTLLFNQLNAGQLALMQGLQKIRYLAKASLAGNITGLLVTVPLYYYFGNDGIVPALVATSIISLYISWYFASKIHIKPTKFSRETAFAEGKNMLKIGFLINLSTLMVALTTYIVQLFISNSGGIVQVGLFTAGFAIINTYVGLVFNAMGTDYYPRLSAVAHSNEACKKTINQQGEISILILGPIVMFFLIFAKVIILVLYSDKFGSIEDMVMWLSLATFFKAGSWAIAFILLAKGVSKLFFWNELAANAYALIFDLLGYYFWGLTGLGVACFLAFTVYFAQVYMLCKSKYNFGFEKSFIKIFTVQFSLAILCFLAGKFLQDKYSYIFGVILIVCAIAFSYVELNKRLGLQILLNEFLNKLKK